MRRDATTPEAYRADVTGAQGELLEAIREVVRAVAPDVEEGIRYGMLDYPGLANLAAQKSYVSLYVPSSVLEERSADFTGVDRGKSCLRFRRLDEVDGEALRRLLVDVRTYRRRESSAD